MAFSRISSSFLRRNPFTSRFMSSSSSSIILTSKSHFSNPRNTDFLQFRKYVVEASRYEVEKLRAELKFNLYVAGDAVDEALQSKKCFINWPNYKRKAERANEAVNIVLEKFDELMSVLDEDEKKDFDKFDSRWIELLQQSREEMMNDELMQHDLKQEDVSNYIQFLQNQHGVIAGDEEHKGSGGVGDISREEEHMGSGGAGDISTEEKHKGSGGAGGNSTEELMGSGGVEDISIEEEHMGSVGVGEISTEEEHKENGGDAC